MSKTAQVFPILAALLLLNAWAAAAQVNSQNRSIMPASNSVAENPGNPVVYGGYQIGVGDILDIHVNDEEDVSGRYQVDQDGKVKVSLLSSPSPAAGSTTFQLSSRLRDELTNQNILRDPSVTVLILREMTQKRTSVLGAVAASGRVYPIEKPTTVVDLISLAGGLAPNAGNSLTITHQVGRRRAA